MKKAKTLLFGLIILVNVCVYFPSFFDSCRGPDHQIFLGEIAHAQSLPDLIKESYSYNRSREQMIGDKVLFRPLLYMTLAVDRWLFGYDFFWWQLIAFILHLAAQGCLFKVLNDFVSVRWSFAIVLLNSLLLLQQEMVGRHHLSGYLFFQIFALLAVYQFFKYCQNPDKNKKLFFSAVIWLTVSFFACECALILNALLIGLVWMPWKLIFARFSNRQKALIFLPVTLYGLVSGTDFFLRTQHFSYTQEGLTGSAHLSSFNIGVFLSNFTNIIKMTFQGFLFPAYTKLKFIGHQYHYEAFDFRLETVPQIFNAVLLVSFVGYFIFCISSVIKNRAVIKSFWDPKVFIFGLLMLLFAIGYAGLLCLTRLQLIPDYLRTAPHHLYFIYSFSLLGLTLLVLPFFSFIDHSRLLIKQILFALIISLAGLQGYYTYHLNNDLRAHWEPQRIFLREVDHFVKEHKRELDFSFAIFKSELIYTHLIYLNDQPPKQKNLIEMFFPNTFKTNKARYYLVYTKTQGLRAFELPNKADQYVKEITQKNGNWDQELYIGTSKVDFEKIRLIQKYSEMMQQNNRNP
jgi:hypothetical protein